MSNGYVSIHDRNLRTLAVELFKVFKGLSPVIFAETFSVRQQSQYNMRNYSYRYASFQNGQPWIRKFVIHRFKLAGEYAIPYERDRFY